MAAVNVTSDIGSTFSLLACSTIPRSALRSFANSSETRGPRLRRTLTTSSVRNASRSARKLGGRGVTIVGARRHRLAADGVDRRGHVRVDAARGCIVLARDERLDNRDLVDTVPERPAGRGLPEHHARGEDVGAAIDALARRLLGRHVADLALDDALLRLRSATLGLRDAEVDDLHLPVVGHEDVLGRHVAMDDAHRRAVVVGELVGVVEARERIRDDDVLVLRRERGVRAESAALDAMERLPVEELHRDEVLAVVDIDLERLHDVRMVEARSDAGLVDEHGDEVRILDEVGT